jgi:hypothetical protein
MGSYYQPCPEPVKNLAARLRSKFYPDLDQADVTVGYLFAWNKDGPAISHNSWPAKALAKVTNLRDRVAGLPDALIILDAEVWEELSAKEKEAILDHELNHLSLRRDRVGNVKYDDANRPKMVCKPHDFSFGGFHELVRRYGENSVEAQSVGSVVQTWRQREFDWEPKEETAGV